MKRTPPKRAFTLVELLVVISIIGMLAALLLPAVNAAREAARKAVCNNQQRQLALGILAFETNRGRFPGWREDIFGSTTPGTGREVSWLVSIMANIDRQDVYDVWNDPNANPASTYVFMKVLRCPSNPETDRTLPQISYVANAGYWVQPNDPSANVPGATNGVPHGYFRGVGTVPFNGVFADRWLAPGIRMKIDNLQKDGASNTLLVSENLLADQWNRTGLENIFVWLYATDSGPSTTPVVMVAPTQTVTPQMRINGQKNVATALTLETTRPSAQHPGGVMVGFADGHTQFLRDNLNYDVYIQLMTPWGLRSDMPYKFTLSDNDY